MNKTITFNPANLMTFNEYADFKKVSRQSVYNWIKEGRVKEIIIRGRRFVDKSTEKPV